ncbi:hypothetical protein [Haladaptatus caseinilyticus]|uniref:hypothetical protein n=1 Tax=Haladaptatus caseinilyticus TaxID=2993314 RepID=UPI00224A5627|nr:hypothetical protein [Haladaptatus caseinilyticus]
MIAGGLLVVFWFVGPPLYAVGYGQVAIGALFSLDGFLTQIAIAEIGLLYALLTPSLTLDHPTKRLVAAVAGMGVLIGGILVGISWHIEEGNIGIVLLGVLGIIAYSMHRYERVAVGAIGGSHE